MTVDAWSKTPDALSFDWQMERQGDQLQIHYTVQNGASETAWIADQLVQTSQGAATLLSRPIVRRSGRPHTALVALGLAPPDVPLAYLPPPTYRSVAPGASYAGVVAVDLPLVSWHPAGKVDALDEPTSVIFAIDGFLGEPASWKSLKEASGTPFQTPVYKTRLWLWSDAKAVPGR